jgi:hypothetical protein
MIGRHHFLSGLENLTVQVYDDGHQFVLEGPAFRGQIYLALSAIQRGPPANHKVFSFQQIQHSRDRWSIFVGFSVRIALLNPSFSQRAQRIAH